MAKPSNCCIACKNIEDLFGLHDGHECSDTGDIEASATMLKECFNIEITRASNFTSICGQCMLRLRDAHQFRKDIIKSIQELQKQLCFVKSNPENTVSPNVKSQSRGSEETRVTTKNGGDNLAENIDENLNLNVVTHENTLFIELHPLEKNKKTDAYRGAVLQSASEAQYKIQPGQTDCRICNLTFPSTKSLQGHMNVHFARYVCEKCSARFEADHKLRRHMATVHMEGPFICTICDQPFSKLNTLNAHIWRAHQTVDPYKCPKCVQRFRTFHKRLRHLQEDHGMTEAKYPCPYCEKKFFYAGSRSTHIRLTHLQERRYKCAHCPMAFAKRRMLLSHMSTKHGVGEKRYQCDKCQKRFYRSNTLKYHMKTHENAELELHQCPVCDVRFSYKNHLKFHMKCHVNTQDRSSMERNKDAQETSILKCHMNAQKETPLVECPKNGQEIISMEENLVIVDDKLYDVTGDTVYLEIYET